MSQKIEFKVELGEDGIPEEIQWINNDQKSESAKAILISIFERNTKETLRMDLWTKDLQLMEMDRLMYYTLKSLAETYHKSTNNKNLAEAMHVFSTHFGEETGILKKDA